VRLSRFALVIVVNFFKEIWVLQNRKFYQFFDVPRFALRVEQFRVYGGDLVLDGFGQKKVHQVRVRHFILDV
jgi:hypothetical protein